MNKNTYLSLILTEVGYEKQTEHTSGGLSDTFQTMGRQGDFRPNHRRVMCNYHLLNFKEQKHCKENAKRFTSLLTPLPSGPIISSHSSKTPHSPFLKFQICNIYKLKKKKKKLGYCVMSQLHRLPWPVNHAVSVPARSL